MSNIYSGSIIIVNGQMFRFAYVTGTYIDNAQFLLAYPCGHITRGTVFALNQLNPTLQIERRWSSYMGSRQTSHIPVFIYGSDNHNSIEGRYYERNQRFELGDSNFDF